MTNPALILADEPTGNLDTKTAKEVLDIVGLLNADGGTVVLITHDPDVAEGRTASPARDGEMIEDVRPSPRRGRPLRRHGVPPLQASVS